MPAWLCSPVAHRALQDKKHPGFVSLWPVPSGLHLSVCLLQGGPGHLYLLKNKVATFAKVEKEEDMIL